MEINGYQIQGEFSAENAGCSVWARCRKNNHDFFIKKFTDVAYPLSNKLSPDLRRKKLLRCEEFFQKKQDFYRHLVQCRSGNIILVHDFFRYETAYYVVTDLEKRSPLSVRAVAALDSERKLVLIKSVLYSFAMLDFKGIVHSDVKPANILVVPTENGFCTGKIIDFDLGFHADSPPPEPGGDLVYLAPEALAAIKGRKTPLTPKMDVFALGLIFHEYWTGERPRLPRGFNYACEAVAAGKPMVLDKAIPEGVRAILAHMLLNDPRERFSAGNALAAFAKIAAGSGKAPVRSSGKASERSFDRKSGSSAADIKRETVKKESSAAVKPRIPDKAASRGGSGIASGKHSETHSGTAVGTDPGKMRMAAPVPAASVPRREGASEDAGKTAPRKTDPGRSEEPSSPRLKIRMGSHSSSGKPAPSPGSSRKRPGAAFYHPDDFD